MTKQDHFGLLYFVKKDKVIGYKRESSMRILLVEDDELLGEGTRKGLSQDGYTVDWVKDGMLADQALKTEKFDLVVLDLGLPKFGGTRRHHSCFNSYRS